MLEKKAATLCLSCGSTVKGRADKKFCNDYCRNEYNNGLKSSTTNLVRNINNALGKNRRVLETLINTVCGTRGTVIGLAEILRFQPLNGAD